MHVPGNPHGEDGHFPHTSVGVGKGTGNSTVGGRGQDVLNEDYALALALGLAREASTPPRSYNPNPDWGGVSGQKEL